MAVEQRNKKQYQRTGTGGAILIFYAITILLPLYVENRYFNIVEAKAFLLSLICGVAWLLATISCLRTRGEWLRKQRLNMLDIAVICMAITAAISCICSGNFRESFWGSYGWGMGGFILLSLAMLYFFLSRTLHLTWKNCFPVILVVCVVAGITIAHSMDVDVFSLHIGISDAHRYLFKSTLGNLNAHAGYVCLLFPVALILFADEENSKRLPIVFLFSVALLSEIAFGCTDSVYLGIGLCAFAAIPYLCAIVQRLRRTCLLISVFGGLLLLGGQCRCFAASVTALGGLSLRMHAIDISWSITLVGICGYIVLHLWPHVLERRQVRYACVVLLEMLLLAVVVYFSVDAVQHFSDTWGSNRGKIWRLSLESYQGFNIKQKLFGIGPEMQQPILSAWHRKWPVYVCHSEPIQILLTMGVVGVLAWCAAYAFVIIDFVRKRMWNTKQILFVLPILAYMGQSLLNSAVATNLGVLCVISSCYRRFYIKGGARNIQHTSPSTPRKKRRRNKR